MHLSRRGPFLHGSFFCGVLAPEDAHVPVVTSSDSGRVSCGVLAPEDTPVMMWFDSGSVSCCVLAPEDAHVSVVKSSDSAAGSVSCGVLLGSRGCTCLDKVRFWECRCRGCTCHGVDHADTEQAVHISPL